MKFVELDVSSYTKDAYDYTIKIRKVKILKILSKTSIDLTNARKINALTKI